MNDIEIFENPEFGKVRTIAIDDEPWFIGKDVAEALGYVDTFGALKKHVDREDKQVCKNNSFESPRGLTIINESGLYSLVLYSRLPRAKKFHHWVTSELLPSIHKPSNSKVLEPYEPHEGTLVRIENDQIVTDSRSVAENFGKAHGNVLKSIDNLMSQNQLTKNMFLEQTREHRGRDFRYYLMNRDGFSLLIMGFTGKAALEWKLKYIQAFNAMEKEIANRSIINPAELSLRKDELAIHKAELYLRIADNVQIPEYKQIINSLAVEAMSGKMYLPLPEVSKKTFSATEIGNLLGASSNKIGRLSKQLGMKIPEYGKFFYDKAKGCNKQVETFRYYENAIDVFRDALQEERGLNDENMG